MKEIYINGERVDSDEKTDVNISYKSPLFSDLQAISANTTLTIKLPKSAHNRAVIQNASSAGVQSLLPYDYLKTNIIEDGFEIIDNGRGYVMTISEVIEMSVIFGGISSFTAIKDVKLPQMQVPNEGVIDWNDNSQWVATSLELADVMFLRTNFGFGLSIWYPIQYAHPSVRVSAIIKWINQLYGLNITPTLGSHLAVPCVTKKRRDKVTLPTIFQTYYAYPHLIQEMHVEIVGWMVSQQSFKYKTNPQNKYDIAFEEDGRIQLNGYLTYDKNYQAIVKEFKHIRVCCDGEWTDYVKDTLDGNCEIDVAAGSHYEFTLVDTFEGTGGMVSLHIKPIGEDVMYGEKFDALYNLPDMKITDFIKAIFALEGKFPVLVDGVIEAISVDDVYTKIPAAKDWSGKLLNHKSSSFRFGSFGRQNIVKWADDDSVPTSASTPAIIYVDNATIEPTYDCVKLPFAACKTFSNEVYIPLYINEAKEGEPMQVEYQSSVKPRIVEIENVAGKQPKAITISLPEVVTEKYSKYQEVIRNPRVEKCTFHLSPRDVAGLDLTVPIYVEQLGAHYAIINLMVKENETEAELLQL